MANAEKSRPYVAVMLLLRKDDKILLQRRYKTGYADGLYNPVSGHVDSKESAVEALVREAREEANISVDPKDLKFVHLLQFLPPPGDKEYMYMYFECTNWKGEPKIMEPEKHDDLSWFSLNQLPDNIVKSMHSAIEYYKQGITYSEFNTPNL